MMNLRAALVCLLVFNAGHAMAEQPVAPKSATPIPPFASYKLSPYEKQERLRVYSWGVLRQKGKDCHNVAWSARQQDASILAVCTSKKQRAPMRYRIVDTGASAGERRVQVQTL